MAGAEWAETFSSIRDHETIDLVAAPVDIPWLRCAVGDVMMGSNRNTAVAGRRGNREGGPRRFHFVCHIGGQAVNPLDPTTSSPDRLPAENVPVQPVSGSRMSSQPQSRAIALALAAGLLAAVSSSFAGELILNHYWSDLVPTIQAHPSAGAILRLNAARLCSATYTFATMGGLLGLALGLAGGLGRRSVKRGAGAAIVGLVLGTAVTALVARLLVSNFLSRHDPQSGDLLLPLLTQGAVWSAIGASAGLAFGIGYGGRRRWQSTLVGGLLGAAAAAVVYQFAGALVFPTSNTDLPLASATAARALAQFLAATFSALGAVLGSGQFDKLSNYRS
jgi:hypothetical protein